MTLTTRLRFTAVDFEFRSWLLERAKAFQASRAYGTVENWVFNNFVGGECMDSYIDESSPAYVESYRALWETLHDPVGRLRLSNHAFTCFMCFSFDDYERRHSRLKLQSRPRA